MLIPSEWLLFLDLGEGLVTTLTAEHGGVRAQVSASSTAKTLHLTQTCDRLRSHTY